MDWILPDTVRFSSRTVQYDDLITHNFRLRDYPMVVGNAWGSTLFNILGTKVVLKMTPIDRYKGIRQIDRSIDELRESDAKVKEISLGLFIDEHYTILTVTDTGRGLPPQIRDHLFEKGASTKGRERGTGLFLVKELVEKYHGTVEVDTEPGEGTSITVSFQSVTEGEADGCTE